MSFAATMNWDWLLLPPEEAMAHPGMPGGWAGMVLAGILLLVAWAILIPVRSGPLHKLPSLALLPVIGPVVRKILVVPWVLLALRIVVAAIFLLVIYAGLWERHSPSATLPPC